MAFDPDKYLAETADREKPQPKAKKGFDPDAYLRGEDRGNIINSDVPSVVGSRPNAVNEQPQQAPVSLMDRLKTTYEVPRAIGQSMVSEPLAMAYGAGRGAIDRITTGQNAPDQANKYYQEAADAMRYTPSSPESMAVLNTIGEGLKAAKVPLYTPGVGKLPSFAAATEAAPNMMANALRRTKSAVQPAINKVDDVVRPAAVRLAEALKAEQTGMPGVGAAAVDPAMTRMQTAQQLRVPIKLRKGQVTQELADQQFETETAKVYSDTVGKPLLADQADQNRRILSNFDAYLDPIGSKVAGEDNLYEVGKVVDKAVVAQAKKAKDQIRAEYKLARDAGETNELIDVSKIKSHLNNLEAEEVNAPVITSARMKLDKLAPDGQMSINDLEEVRKMVGRVSGSTPTNMTFGKEIKDLIDASTEGKGGELYQKARQSRTQYAKQFENIGAIDKLLGTKPGTTDRSVAFENVFDHAILKGSLDDTRAIGLLLKKAGPEGQEAWRELVGQTVEHMRSSITKSIKRDPTGQPIVSPAQFNTVVKNLDRSGKLDYLFGKKGAQEIRDLRDTTMTVYNQQGGINNSNTSSAITKEFNRIIGKIPMAGPLVSVGSEILEKRKIAKQVNEALNYTPEQMAKALKQRNEK